MGRSISLEARSWGSVHQSWCFSEGVIDDADKALKSRSWLQRLNITGYLAGDTLCQLSLAIQNDQGHLRLLSQAITTQVDAKLLPVFMNDLYPTSRFCVKL